MMQSDPMKILETKEEREKELNYFFKDNQVLLERLKILDDKKSQIKKLKYKYGPLQEPIVITISGTPRAGKTTCIDNLYEFLKKADLKTSCLEEPAGLVYQTLQNKEEKAQLLQDRIGFVEKQYEIGYNQVNSALSNNDIILCDRGILDTFIWYNMYHKLGMMDKKRYDAFIENIKNINGYKNIFYMLYANNEQSMLRDYLSSLSIEQRTTMNRQNVERYNDAMMDLIPTFEKYVDSKLIDTSNIGKMDASIIIANEVLDVVGKQYAKKKNRR